MCLANVHYTFLLFKYSGLFTVKSMHNYNKMLDFPLLNLYLGKETAKI